MPLPSSSRRSITAYSGLTLWARLMPGLQALGRVDLEAAPLERTLQAAPQRRVVVDQDEERRVAGRPLADGQRTGRGRVSDVFHHGSSPRRPASMMLRRPAQTVTRAPSLRVVKMNLGAGPGKQGVGDEDAEAEAAFVTPGRKERLAQPVEHFGRRSPGRRPRSPGSGPARDGRSEISTSLRGELDRVVDQVGQRVPQLRRQRHLRLGRAVAPARRSIRHLDPRPRILARDMLEQARERRAGEAAMAVVVGALAQPGQQLAAALAPGPADRRASSASGLPSGSSRTSSLAMMLIVAKGVPSRWATAAAWPPSAESCCSRASASWVAVRASERCRASSATLQANTAISMVARLRAAQPPTR